VQTGDSGALGTKAPRLVNSPLVKHATAAPCAQGKFLTEQAPGVANFFRKNGADLLLLGER